MMRFASSVPPTLAEVLTALEKLAQQLGGEGLEFWEQLEQQMEETE